MRQVLFPLSYLYKKIMDVRNSLYDSGFFKTIYFNVPIVSVGNITMGGTGKTPIICEFIEWAQARGLKPGVVSRGYRGNVKGVQAVPKEAADTHVYGDEPCMIKMRFPDVPVYVGSDRADVVRELVSQQSVNIIFADDAFQHRRLGRNIDVVVVDATEEKLNYKVIPEGRAREAISCLRRADFIILNKVNLVSPDQKKSVLEFLESQTSEREVPIIESEYYIKSLRHGRTGVHEENVRFEPVFLFSAIGNPKGFQQLIEKSFDVRGHMPFRDHHNFSEQDMKNIIRRGEELGASKILCTEKDLVKLSEYKQYLDKVWCVELSVKLSIRFKQLYERIIEHIN